MDRLYPGLGHHLEEVEITVAIDGEIHETAYCQPIRPGGQVIGYQGDESRGLARLPDAKPCLKKLAELSEHTLGLLLGRGTEVTTFGRQTVARARLTSATRRSSSIGLRKTGPIASSSIPGYRRQSYR